MVLEFLKKWGSKAPKSSVNVVSMRREGDVTDPPVERSTGEESDEHLCKKRWENPPPGQLLAMADAVVNIDFFGGSHFHRKPILLETATSSRLVTRQDTKKPPIQVALATRITRDLISLQAKSIPTVGADAVTSDQNDKFAARVAQALLKEYQASYEYAKTRVRLGYATQLTGVGVLYTRYDPSAGERYFVPGDEEMQARGVAGHLAVEGSMRDVVGSCLNVRMDPSALDPDEAQWAMIGSVMHVERAREVFENPDIEPDQNLNYHDFLGHALPMNSDSTALWYENQYVHVKEYYERSSAAHPDGRQLVFVGSGDKVEKIVDEPNPFSGAKLPFHFIPAIRRFDSPWGYTTLRFLRSLNKVFDARISQYITDANLVGRARLLIEKNSGISPTTLDESGLKILEYLAGSVAPTYIQPPNYPAWIINVIPLLQQLMEYVAGTPDVMKGVNPPGSRSGEMIGHLMEQAHSLFYTNFIDIEAASEGHAQVRLKGCQTYYTVPRIMRSVGDDLVDDIVQYTGADLVGSVRVKATAGSALPRSRSMRLQQLMYLYQAQLISKDEMEEFSEHAVLEDIHVDLNLERRLIGFENRVLLGQGFPLMPQDHDNHEMHLRHHNRLRKKPEWFSLPKQLQDLFVQHCDVHVRYLRAQFGDMTGDQLAQVGTMQQMMRPKVAA